MISIWRHITRKTESINLLIIPRAAETPNLPDIAAGFQRRVVVVVVARRSTLLSSSPAVVVSAISTCVSQTSAVSLSIQSKSE